jgi:anti-sigma regulatory factor (Ser/Thr protein kinase)
MSNSASLPAPQEWDVEPSALAVPAARRLVVETARSWRVPLSDGALHDVELCASELVANATEHTGARCRVRVLWTGERLRVEVVDSSLRPPDRDSARDLVTGGRGLLLVEGLSHAWGWNSLGSGKVVWFEVAADEVATGDRRLGVLVNAARGHVAGEMACSA